MRKYSRRVVDYLMHSNEIKLTGIANEVVKHYEPSIRVFKSTEDKPIIIECFGITNPDKGYAVSREKSHNFVLEYIESGKGHVEIEGDHFDVQAGDVYLLYPNTKQHYYADEKEPFKKYWVNFMSTDIEKMLDTLNIKGVHHFPKCNLFAYFIQLFSLEEIHYPSTDFFYFAYNTIISMLVEMKKSLLDQKDDGDIASQIKKIIDGNVAENIKITDICGELMISKSYLIKTFKDKYGVTPNQYKLKQKMDTARKMLMNENVSIKQIALSLGFNDQYHFSNSFKKYNGVFPSKYRKMYIENLSK